MTIPSGALVILTNLPVGRGTSGPRWASIGAEQRAALWKPNDPAKNPHMLANELICRTLAKELGLPVPDSFPHRVSGGLPVFLQLNFNGNGPLLPPVTPPQCIAAVAEEPVMTARIVAFDALIMNTDRHNENVAFRSRKPGPGMLVVYDHGHALFGAGGMALAKTKFRRIDWLGCDGDGKPEGRNCFLDHLQDSNALGAAIAKVEALDDQAIANAVLEARAYGLANDDANRVSDALRRRRDRIRSIVGKNKKQFPGITQWSLEIPP